MDKVTSKTKKLEFFTKNPYKDFTKEEAVQQEKEEKVEKVKETMPYP